MNASILMYVTTVKTSFHYVQMVVLHILQHTQVRPKDVEDNLSFPGIEPLLLASSGKGLYHPNQVSIIARSLLDIVLIMVQA